MKYIIILLVIIILILLVFLVLFVKRSNIKFDFDPVSASYKENSYVERLLEKAVEKQLPTIDSLLQQVLMEGYHQGVTDGIILSDELNILFAFNVVPLACGFVGGMVVTAVTVYLIIYFP